MLEFRPTRITELREAHSITAEEMAIRLGKSKQQIGIWENGVNYPSIENLLLICNVFDVDASFFFDNASKSVEEKPAN